MATALGLVGLLVFIACVVGLAAGSTWLVVRVSPDPNKKKKKPVVTPDAPAPEA